MKKALLTAAIAAALLGPTVAVTSPAFADQTVAQSAMMPADPGLKAVMDKLHDQMSAMTPSGNTDKDYAATMKMLVGAMKGAAKAEMHDGKNPKAMANAKSVYDMLFRSSPIDESTSLF